MVDSQPMVWGSAAWRQLPLLDAQSNVTQHLKLEDTQDTTGNLGILVAIKLTDLNVNL